MNVIDDFNRQALAIEVDLSLSANREQLIEGKSKSSAIRATMCLYTLVKY
jgi:putative transposase